MNREDVVKMAEKSGISIGAFGGRYQRQLERFAALVAAAEREACARMVDHILKEGGGTYGKAIRARGET